MFLDTITSIIGLIGLLILAFLRYGRSKPKPKRRPKPKSPVEKRPPANAIVVDGSNVMHWGEGASVKTISRVMQDIVAQGYAPIVFFDANVGYVLGDRYFDEAKLASLIGVPQDHICVVSKGVVADQAILAFATDHGLRIVTNDRYRDWRVAFPHAAKKGTLVGGDWRDGNVKWRGKL